ncbi:cytochrome P450 [Fomitopsis serialis]|uniref:cytochrome P450 n=1 Tax=Fomitopsis serialis TaxID=139415 RepID=UPI0020074D86|nr:cytochrome P450 [Neoantrodia serialis]KAH9928846.1 cytochrome P450 [Neoantrodia serialis]
MSLLLATYASIACGLLYLVRVFSDRHRCMSDIPTVGGPSLPIFSYIGAIRSLVDAANIIQDGYAKYKNHCFKYAELGYWCVLVTSPAAVEELARAPEDVVSFSAAAIDLVQIPYTLGPNIARDPYHIRVLRTRLMRNVPRIIDDLRDEIVCTFNDKIRIADSGNSNEWVSIGLKDVAFQSVCRAANRIFVGLPVCRDPDYIAVNEGFTMDVVVGSTLIKLFPSFLKPFVAKFCTNIPRSVDRVVHHLEPIIKERLLRAAMDVKPHYADDEEDNPSDLLQWLIEGAQESTERTVSALALRVLVVNFAALHTTSTVLTHSLSYLAAYPEHAASLRDEVDRVVQADGWSKAAVGNMCLVDSFLKEVGRVTGLGAISINRKTVQDYTISDGTFIPKGTFLAAAARPIHFDGEHYANPDVFDPWRFVNGGGKDHMIKTSDHYLLWGHGRHACPGRFFAATMLKLILAHVVMTYDVRSLDGVAAHATPPPTWISASMIPNRKAKVLFRERQPKR